MLICALAYDIEVKYLKGKKMLLADTLSRAYINNTQSREGEFESMQLTTCLCMQKESLTSV